MSNILIRKVNVNEWQILRDLRNQAIVECPTFFSIDPTENNIISENKWKEIIIASNNDTYQFLLFLIADNEIAGMAGGIWDNSIKLKHTGSLIWLYIKPEYRSKGYGSLLINDVIERLRQKGKNKIKLIVSGNNFPAINLYTKMGFRKVGTLEKEILYKGEFIDEEIMEKFI